MSISTKKRTLDAFFKPIAKKARVVGAEGEEPADNLNSSDPNNVSSCYLLYSVLYLIGNKLNVSRHPIYPFPIPEFSAVVSSELSSFPSTAGTEIKDQANLDLLYFKPYIHKNLERQVFRFLRSELPFYRVEYNIKRGGMETQIKTPR